MFPANTGADERLSEIGIVTLGAKNASLRPSTKTQVALAHITELANPHAPLGGLTLDALHAAFSHFGRVEKIVCSTMPKAGTPVQYVDALIQFDTHTSAREAIAAFDQQSMTGDGSNLMQMRLSRHDRLMAQNSEKAHDYTRAPTPGQPLPSPMRPGGAAFTSPVCHVANLDASHLDADLLFNLFSPYGYIAGVRLPYPHTSEAFVQYASGEFVDLAIQNLSLAALFGRQIVVTRAQVQSVEPDQEPDRQPGVFTSYKHAEQYWPPGKEAQIAQHASPPRATVFLKNIPHGTPEDHVIAVCARYGTVRDFAFLPRKGDRFATAVVQMDSVEEAILLVALGQKSYFEGANQAMRLMANFAKYDRMPSNVERNSTTLALAPGARQHVDPNWQNSVALDWAEQAVGGRVALVTVGELQWPEAMPIATLTVEGICESFWNFGTLERVVCAAVPGHGPPFDYILCAVQFLSSSDTSAAISALDNISLTNDGYHTLRVVNCIELPPELGRAIGGPHARDYGYSCDGSIPAEAHVGAGSPNTTQLSYLGRTAHSAARSATQGDKRVVMAHVTNLTKPHEAPLGGLELDVLHSVFGQCGAVEKIVCTTKPKQGTPVQYVDVMVQFRTHDEAAEAVRVCDGTSLSADGCNNAQMKFSVHSELHATDAYGKAKDFTKPSIPGPGFAGLTPGLKDALSAAKQAKDVNPGIAGKIDSIKDSGVATALKLLVSAAGGTAQPLSWPCPQTHQPHRPRTDLQLQQQPLGRQLSTGSGDNGAAGESRVAMAFNLNEDLINVDILCNVFSSYGYVETVKIVFKRRHTAMVQYSDPGFVDLAAHYLNGAVLLGKPLSVSRSKQASIRCTERDNMSAERTTRCFMGVQQYWEVEASMELVSAFACAPGTSLALRGIPPEYTEADVVQICSQFGSVSTFHFQRDADILPPDGKRSGIMQVASSEDAVAIAARAPQHQALSLKIAFTQMSRS